MGSCCQECRPFSLTNHCQRERDDRHYCQQSTFERAYPMRFIPTPPALALRRKTMLSEYDPVLKRSTKP